MANTAEKPEEYQRAAAFVQGIGDNLDKIQNRDVLLRGFIITERTMRGAKQAFVELSISEVGDAEIVQYHAWSQPLADKLADIPDEALPLLIQFFRDKTSSGNSVWSFR